MSLSLMKGVQFAARCTAKARNTKFCIWKTQKYSFWSITKPTNNSKSLSLQYIQNMHETKDVEENHEENIENHARLIFGSAVKSVMPKQMLEGKMKYDRDKNVLCFNDKDHVLNNNVYVVGFGKAVSGMARIVEDLISDHIVRGIISIPVGMTEQMKDGDRHELLVREDGKIQVYEGAENNMPDEAAHTAAKAIHELVAALGQDDILIVLVSGGGSSLLPMPCPPISLFEEQKLTKLLSTRGATIQELNTIRSNIEILKGGGLALEAKPATVLSLILSDVIGDPLDFIASGPTFQSAVDPSQCFHLFKHFNVMDEVPQSVKQYLEGKVKASRWKGDPDLSVVSWNWVENCIVGNNTIATAAAASRATELGYLPLVLSTSLDGDTREVASLFGKIADYILLVFKKNSRDYSPDLTTLEVELVTAGISKDVLNKVVTVVEKCKSHEKSICVISGGETTTHVKGSGRGGRCQEMALGVAPLLRALKDNSEFRSETECCFLCAGTDGIDGRSDVAGAVVDIEFATTVSNQGYSLEEYLENNDSYTLFRNVGNGSHHIVTGHTGTNVMDVQVLIIKP